MGLLQLLPTSTLGYGGQQPQFNGETPGSTLHNQSSINDRPDITRNPSGLDELDNNNTSKYTSAAGQKYTDRLPH